MTTKAKKYDVTIFGDTYSLVSDEKYDAVVRSAEYLDELMQDISAKSRALDTKKIAILAALHIAHELHSLKEVKQLEQEYCANIIAQIDQKLSA